MKIFIDSEFKCHTADPSGDLREVETDFFDGKCSAFVEGYRMVPEGAVWSRSDGMVFPGEMIAPWKPYSQLAAAQGQYEADQAELEAAYQEGVNSV